MMRIITPILALFALSTVVNAAPFVVQPTDATASSAPNSSRKPDKTIDGSGLSDPTIVETNDPVPNPWPSHDTNNQAGWFSDDDVLVETNWIAFDLGAIYEITGLHIWNWNFNGGGTNSGDGIKDVNVEFSNDSGFSTILASEAFVFGQAPALASYEGEHFSLSSSVSAQHVRFDVQSTFNTAFGDVGKAALSLSLSRPSLVFSLA